VVVTEVVLFSILGF